MTRASLAAAALLAVAACVQVPNDVAEGVGFQDYEAYEARRAMLRGEHLTPPETVRPPNPVTVSPVLVADADTVPAPATQAPAVAPATDPLAAIAASAIAEAEAETPTPPEPAPTEVALARAAAPPPVPRGNPGISDEQSFDAVAARETIESDAERLARMQAERVEVAPTALPTRSGETPSIVAFALETAHPVGTRLYTRNPLNRGRHEEACRAFRAPDLAQEWFLANGGPVRDRRALDPDGDGFACTWNPEVYRAAARSTSGSN